MELPGEGVMVGMSACLGCGITFMYDVDRVPSCRYVRRVRNSLELALAELPGIHTAGTVPGHAGPQEDCGTCQEVARVLTAEAVAEPICPKCCVKANPERASRGLELLPVTDSLDHSAGWRP